jgi:hypothetical protein
MRELARLHAKGQSPGSDGALQALRAGVTPQLATQTREEIGRLIAQIAAQGAEARGASEGKRKGAAAS